MDNIIDISSLISLIISICAAIFITIKEFFFSKWNKKHDKDIEIIRGISSHQETLYSQIISSLSNISNNTNEIRLQHYQTIWDLMIELKNLFPANIFLAYEILTKQEFENIPNNNSDKMREFKNLPTQESYLASLKKILQKAEHSHIFIDADTWNIFYTYQRFFGRLFVLYYNGINSSKMVHFTGDDYTKEFLLEVIDDTMLTKILSVPVLAFISIKTYFEVKYIEQASKLISGKNITKEVILQADELFKIANLEKIKDRFDGYV
jgi:hypothetical protein